MSDQRGAISDQLGDQPSTLFHSSLFTLPPSLSSMWARDRFARAEEFTRAAAEFGFGAFEFNYEAPPAWIEEPLAGLPCSSLHNPCPQWRLPDGRWSQELSYGAIDEDERRVAVRLARTTLDHAARVGARAIVVHVATIPVDIGLQSRLKELFAAGQAGSDEFFTVRDTLAAERAAKAGPHVEQSARSVRELAPYAAERGIVLGLESRVNVYEIPNLPEMHELLDAGRDGLVGYWHDVGHCEVQERLGFGTHRAWLEQLGDRIVGTHLHEVRGVVDHYAVGRGEMPWAMIAPFLPADAIRTCEFDRRNPPESVAQAVRLLREYGVVSAQHLTGAR